MDNLKTSFDKDQVTIKPSRAQLGQKTAPLLQQGPALLRPGFQAIGHLSEILENGEVWGQDMAKGEIFSWCFCLWLKYF